MQTEHLIDLLSTNLDAEPADLRQLSHVLRRSLFIAAATTFGTAWVVLGIRPDLNQATTIATVSGQVLVAGATIAIASVCLFRLARPGGEYKTSLVAVGIPFAAAFLVAGISLGLAPSAQWQAIAFAGGWLKCLVLIPLIAILPFSIIAFAMHEAAPTDLVRAGAVTGLLAGSLGAAAYIFHSYGESLLFVAIWYGCAVLICTVIGALLGPYVMRW